MACPLCKSHEFYIKDPSDEYEVFEFELHDGEIRFAEPDDSPDKVGNDNEIFCQRCAWHGKKSAVDQK